jgi:hypothetical protein
MRSKKRRSARKPIFVIFITLLLAIVPTQLQARKFKVLHTFHGPDGAIPHGLLGQCASFFLGCGTAFKLNASGKLLWSHSFNLGNGADPVAGITRDPSGNLYGTAYLGGDTKCWSFGEGQLLSPF